MAWKGAAPAALWLSGSSLPYCTTGPAENRGDRSNRRPDWTLSFSPPAAAAWYELAGRRAGDGARRRHLVPREGPPSRALCVHAHARARARVPLSLSLAVSVSRCLLLSLAVSCCLSLSLPLCRSAAPPLYLSVSSTHRCGTAQVVAIRQPEGPAQAATATQKDTGRETEQQFRVRTAALSGPCSPLCLSLSLSLWHSHARAHTARCTSSAGKRASTGG